MRFHHSPEIWASYPTLVAGVIHTSGITDAPDVESLLPPYAETARRRLAERPLSEFPEIQAWRRAFSVMGLKPTQYRCASESLLRRFHKEGDLPRIHPLVDLCNHVSIAGAVPIAVFDLAGVGGDLEVRPATGEERYATFSGEDETPEPGEIVFADKGGRAHARRWCNRQSATSAIRDTTSDVLIVMEAHHDGARADLEELVDTLTGELGRVWDVRPASALLSAEEPDFTW